MKDYLLRKFNAMDAAYTICKNDTASIVTIAEAALCLNSLGVVIEAIRIKEEIQSTATSGLVLSREAAENNLIRSMMIVGSAGFLQGKKIQDEALKAICDFHEYELRKEKIELLFNRADSLKKTLTPMKPDLVGHGVTEEKWARFETDLDAYKTKMGAKTSGEAAKKAATASLPELINEGYSYLEDMDRYMNIFEEEFPDLADMYRAARVIKDIGIRHEEEEEVPETNAPVAPQG